MKNEDGDMDLIIDSISLSKGRHLTIDGDGKFIYNSDEDTYILLFEVALTNKLIETIQVHPEVIQYIAASNNEIFLMLHPIAYHRLASYLEANRLVPEVDDSHDPIEEEKKPNIDSSELYILISLGAYSKEGCPESGDNGYHSLNDPEKIRMRLKKMMSNRRRPKLQTRYTPYSGLFFNDSLDSGYKEMARHTFRNMLKQHNARLSHERQSTQAERRRMVNQITQSPEKNILPVNVPILTAVNGNKQLNPNCEIVDLEEDIKKATVESISHKIEPEIVSISSPNRSPAPSKTQVTIARKKSVPEIQVPEIVDENTELCVFPENGVNAIHVCFRDMTRLPYGEMLNDNLVEFGIRNTLESNLAFKKTVYCFTTFFFSTLTQNYQNVNSTKTTRTKWLKANYDKVKRWTRRVDIFSMKHLVIPINEDLHWCLIIIKNPGNLVGDGIKDLSIDDEKRIREQCSFIMLDSIPDTEETGSSSAARANALLIIKDYLEFEFYDKKKKMNPHLHFYPEKLITIKHLYNPVQKNLVDCGVYLLAFFQAYVNSEPTFEEGSYVLDWLKYCPYFELINVKYYREKMIGKIKWLADRKDPRRWSRLEQYEKRRYGVINWSPEHRNQMSRKTRCHSVCPAVFYQQRKEQEKRKSVVRRSHSAPHRTDMLISTIPLVIQKDGQGAITSKI